MKQETFEDFMALGTFGLLAFTLTGIMFRGVLGV